MGGLWTSTRDLARYVAFLMSAYPPRDEADNGPIKRSSAREMQQVGRFQPGGAFRGTVDGPLQFGAGGYGYGLGVSQDCKFDHTVGHGGGLPGYGSLMRWLPEYGVGLIGMSNRTYGGFGGVFNDALNELHKTGALKPRVVQPSPALLSAQADVSQLIIKWDDALANRIAADNLFLDVAAEVRKSRWATLAKEHGVCRIPGTAIEPENALRGTWKLMCERGWLEDRYHARADDAAESSDDQYRAGDAGKRRNDGDDRNSRQNARRVGCGRRQINSRAVVGCRTNATSVCGGGAWGTCRIGETLSGNGTRSSTVRLTCDKGPMAVRVAVEPGTRKVTGVDLFPLREQKCVP